MEALEAALSRRPRLWRIYLALNPCKEAYADGTFKTDGPAFKAFAAVFYLKCPCCAALRGLIAGLLLGLALGALAWLT
jgi:hypothetical protein